MDVTWGSFGTVDSEKMIAILGERCCPQTAKEEGGKTSESVSCNIRKKRSQRQNDRGVFITSRNDPPQSMVKCLEASNK